MWKQIIKGVIIWIIIRIKKIIKQKVKLNQFLENLKVSKNVLIVVNELDDNIILATRNLKNVNLLQANEINTLDIVAADNMIVTVDAVKTIEEVLV